MAVRFLLIATLGFAAVVSAAERGPILSAPPPTPDRSAYYLFYLHGRIVQEQGRGATSAEYGRYEYDAILERLAAAGFTVISEVRPRGTMGPAYATVIAQQVTHLLDKGVPAGHITVAGASMGGGIAMTVSTRVATPHVGYVFMASCDADSMAALGEQLHGDVLSIFEASDQMGSCAPAFARAKAIGRHEEIRLTTGLRHGFIYRPLPEWVDPVVRWARKR